MLAAALPAIAVACGYPQSLCSLWIKKQDFSRALPLTEWLSTDYTDVPDHLTLPLSPVPAASI